MLSATVATLLLSYAGTLPAGQELNSSAAGAAYDTWLAEGIARGFIVAADAASPEVTARKPMFASSPGEQLEARYSGGSQFDLGGEAPNLGNLGGAREQAVNLAVDAALEQVGLADAFGKAAETTPDLQVWIHQQVLNRMVGVATRV